MAQGQGNNSGTGGGKGQGTGNRDGKGIGNGRGLGNGGGRGKNNGGGFGNGGLCVCAKCGEKITHEQGIKCTALKCPTCGNTMIREELLQQ